ncbi:MAG: hypothetical protein QM783_00765 [Phycisphaerales bacterium]
MGPPNWGNLKMVCGVKKMKIQTVTRQSEMNVLRVSVARMTDGLKRSATSGGGA